MTFARALRMLALAAALGGPGLMGNPAEARKAAGAPTLFACGDDQVREFAPDADSPRERWRWTASTAPDLSPEWHALLAHVDDCKPVDGGRAILLTSSTGGTVLIDRATGRIVFRARTPMAHSADLLPGGLIAVALSVHEQGNRLQIYRRDRSETPVAEMPLRSGHGAVWDARRKRLFVLSHDAIQAVTVTDRGGTVQIAVEHGWTLPGHRDGHDLSPRGDGTYFVTTSADGVWTFDPGTGAFAPFARLNPARDVKAISQSGSTLAWMQAEESWWAHGFWTAPLGEGMARRYPVPDLHLYKVRWTR